MLFSFLWRPSILGSLLLVLFQFWYGGPASLFGHEVKAALWIHSSVEHLTSNLAFFIPLSFLNENRLGNAKIWLFSLLSLLAQFAIFQFLAPLWMGEAYSVGISGLVASHLVLLALTRSSIWLRIFAILASIALIIPALIPDGVSRVDHALGLILGWALARLIAPRPRCLRRDSQAS